MDCLEYGDVVGGIDLMTVTASKTKWLETKIGDACTVGDGAHAKIKRQAAGIIYLTSKNIKHEKLNLANIDYISEADFKKYFRKNSKVIKTPQIEDVLLCIIGASMGDSCFVKVKKKFGLSSSVAILRANPSILFPKYLYYWTRGHIFQDALYGIKGGAAQGYASQEMIKSLPLNYPPLHTQRKIAAILSAYDDLIENNTRRIEILEEMARSLYRQWFINFRFPGHEQVKMVDSELGLVPEGWEVTSIGNHINTQKGYAFKSSWYQEEGIKIVKVSDFTDDSIDISKLVSISEEIAGQYKKHELEANDIIIQTVGSWASNPQSVVGKVIRVPKIAAKALLNQNAVKVIPKESINQYFLFYSLKNERFKSYIIGCAQGAASQASITLDAIREFKILLPPSNLLDSLDDFVSPMWKLINNLENKNLNLRCARDYLLPILISGEISVEKLGINIEDIAA
jgi:type I restriction enzyme S subunit